MPPLPKDFKTRWLPLTLLTIIVVVGIALRTVAIQRTAIRTFDRPLMDDSFYYFSLGRNLANGAGFRIDAQHLTTGFQPLWGLLSALPYWLTPDAPIMGAQSMGVVVALFTMVALYGFVARLAGSWLVGLFATLLWAVAPPTVVYSVSGMETALAVLAGILVLLTAQAMFTMSSQRAVILCGLTCGAAFLARVDLLIMGAAVGIMLFLFPPLPQRWRTTLIFGVCCLMPILPWALLTLSLGKSPLPESGAAVRLLSSLLEGGANLTFAETLLREIPRFVSRAASNLYLLLALNLSIIGDIGAETFSFASGLAAALWLSAWALARTRIERLMLGLWSLYAVTMIVGYAGFVGASWFYSRYGVPLAETFTMLVIAIPGARIVQARPTVRRWFVGAAVFYLLLTLGIFALLINYGERYTWLIGEPLPADAFYETNQWLNANLAPEDRVGVFQSGIIGYYATMPVINLDGKVNADAHQAMAQGRMWEYLCAAQIDYVADWQILIERFLIERSAAWQESNLELLHTISGGDNTTDWQIYRVNRANCYNSPP